MIIIYFSQISEAGVLQKMACIVINTINARIGVPESISFTKINIAAINTVYCSNLTPVSYTHLNIKNAILKDLAIFIRCYFNKDKACW